MKTLADNGGIEAVVGKNTNTDIKGAIVTLTRDANAVWSCEVSKGDAKGMKAKFVPNGCTKNADITD